jgi:predicted kinase
VAAPTLVVGSGPPRAGKSTRPHPLARAILCPAVCRDEIKEGMAHAAGAGFQGSHGDPLTQRTLPLFFDVVRVLLEGGVTVVAEAAFQDRLWRHGLEPIAGLAQLRVVHCNVDARVSFERAQRRSALDEHRARAHGDSTVGKELADWQQLVGSFERVSIDAPSVEVDTTDGYTPALDDVVAFVNRSAE